MEARFSGIGRRARKGLSDKSVKISHIHTLTLCRLGLMKRVDAVNNGGF